MMTTYHFLCDKCGKEYYSRDNRLLCPTCGTENRPAGQIGVQPKKKEEPK